MIGLGRHAVAALLSLNVIRIFQQSGVVILERFVVVALGFFALGQIDQALGPVHMLLGREAVGLGSTLQELIVARLGRGRQIDGLAGCARGAAG